MSLTTITDLVFGIGTVLMLLAFVVLIVLLIFKRDYLKGAVAKLGSYKMMLILLVLSSGALVGSLWYSEIIGYEPCKLCWYQRIFMYPQVLLLLIAAAIKDKLVFTYTLALSLTGLAIAIFHLFEQRLPKVGLSCGNVGSAISCDTLWVNQFGLITIPLMSLAMFLLLGLLSWLAIKYVQE